jgi:hypothetical protein
MGFLDTIGERGSQSRSLGAERMVDQPPSWNDSTRTRGMSGPDEAPRSNRVHAAVVWSAVLVVVAAVAVAAWLGARKMMTAPGARVPVATDAASEVPAPAAIPTPAARPVRPRLATRRAVTGENRRPIEAGSSNASPEANGEAIVPAPEPATELPAAPDNDTVAIDTSSDPVPAALVTTIAAEDDSVYSSEAADIVAPRLVSLGFGSHPMKGFDVRTSRLELIIAKNGTVERARLFSPSQNWQDAMLLSRAKTFQFVPAQHNGSPVRFRYVMEVDAAP